MANRLQHSGEARASGIMAHDGSKTARHTTSSYRASWITAPLGNSGCSIIVIIATTLEPNRQLVKESEQTTDEQVTAEEASGTRCNWRTSNRFDEQATGEQATCEPATGEQTTGEQATGEQAIGALKRSFLTEVPMLVFTREVS